MTSIFDQYEQASMSFTRDSNKLDINHSIADYKDFNVSTNEKMDENYIFDMVNIDIRKTSSSSYRMQNMSVGGDMIAYTRSNNLLNFFNCRTKENFDEIDVGKHFGSNCRIKHLFLDPIVGYHLLIPVAVCANGNATMSSTNGTNDLLYYNGSINNYKITKLKGYEVTAVGWNRIYVNNHCSSFILLGTSKGLLFEMEIDVESEKLFLSGVETYCRQVFDIGKGNNSASITGIEFHPFTNVRDNYFILVTTANRLYQFIGKTNCKEEKSVLSQIFNNYLTIPEGFIEIPNHSNSSMLRVYYSAVDAGNKDESTSKEINASRPLLLPTYFAWHIGAVGIFLGKLNLSWENGLTNICTQNRIVDYHSSLPSALSIALTRFHVLLLYADKIIAISNINKEIVFVRNNNEMFGKYINLSVDLAGHVWVLCEKNILRGAFFREERMVWKIYMDMNEFSLAKEHCKDDSKLLKIITRKEAEYIFNCGLFEESAALYSQLDDVSFEEIALKFLELNEIEALKLYLYKTLDKLKTHESTHITIISFWLLEMFEKQLSVQKNEKHETDQYRKLQNDFKTFLSYSSVKNCIKTNKEIVYKILTSHGDTKNYISLASANKDYENIMLHYLEKGETYSALNLFKDEPLVSVQKLLTSSFLTEFITVAPKETVDILMKLGRNVDPSSFLASLIIVNDNLNQALEVLRYLEYCVHSLHSRDESIHNYLVTLYVKYKPEKLMKYFESQGLESSMIHYDIRYALKLCQEYDLKEACVQLFSLLGLWESAVDLALNVNLELAKQAVQALRHNPELCKRLWLKIAKHVVHESNDIKKVMEFLQQNDLIKIEDVLPFFSDFVTIDLFKDAICSTLQEYNENIEHLKEEIDDAINSADSIRSNIQSFKHKYTAVHSSDVCCSCGIQLLLRPFYIFPCSHYFHVDCLIMELKPYLDERSVLRLQELRRRLFESRSAITNNEDTVSVNSNHVNSSYSTTEDSKQLLDELIANECFFCGSLAISYIDKPFVDEEEFDKIRSDWQ